jgi:hypothetical protein
MAIERKTLPNGGFVDKTDDYLSVISEDDGYRFRFSGNDDESAWLIYLGAEMGRLHASKDDIMAFFFSRGLRNGAKKYFLAVEVVLANEKITLFAQGHADAKTNGGMTK